MKTKLILLALALTTSASLTSCQDIMSLAQGQRYTGSGDWVAPGSTFHVRDSNPAPCQNTCRFSDLAGSGSRYQEPAYTIDSWSGSIFD